jgi:DNA-binding NarL/FixJ family response regulator
MASLQDVLTKTQSALRENPNLSRKLELLLEKLDDKTDSEENWEKYKILFAQIKPDFFARLNDIGTDINAHDERLAAYLLMGLTSKQISKLLDIGAPTLHNRRSKLRKKLGLDTAQDLTDYLEQI